MIEASQYRRILPSTAVVLAILLGCFVQFTMPRMDRLNAARAEYEALRDQADGTKRSSVPIAVPDDRQIEQLVRNVEALNSAVADPTRVYDRLIEMARVAGLQVESITPSRAETAGTRIDLFGWTMVAIGPFESIVGFVDALNGQEGLHRIASIRLAPSMGISTPSDLTFTISVEYARVLVPDVLATQVRMKTPPDATREATP